MRYRIDDLAELALAFFECRRKAVGQRTVIERRERLAALVRGSITWKSFPSTALSSGRSSLSSRNGMSQEMASA